MNLWAKLAIVGGMMALVAACSGPEAETARQESAQPHYDIGLGALADNNLSKAISELRIAAQEDPANPRNHHALGNAYLRNGQIDEAIASLRRATELNPRLSDAFYDLGLAYIQKQNWDAAIAALRKALANPQYLTPERAYLYLGIIYYTRGQYDQAAEEFRKLVDLFPLSPDGHFFLGRTLRTQGKLAEAQEHVQEAIKLDGNVPIYHLELGLIYLRSGRRAEARDSLRRGLDMNPSGPDTEEARRYLRELH
jgi:tetratricopeptide (TPR) repeat protein